jgi:hypothetical protein
MAPVKFLHIGHTPSSLTNETGREHAWAEERNDDSLLDNGWAEEELAVKLGRVFDLNEWRSGVESQLTGILVAAIQAVLAGSRTASSSRSMFARRNADRGNMS